MYKKLDQAALDAILECGVDEFARCGFQPASVANVARAAGVSVGVIYKYFGDKQSLFLACVRHSLELLDATLREAVPEGADAETSIRALVPALIAAARQHGNYNVLYNEITSGSCREFAPELAARSNRGRHSSTRACLKRRRRPERSRRDWRRRPPRFSSTIC